MRGELLSPDAPSASSGSVPSGKKKRGCKIALISAGALLLVAGGAIVLAPTIASSIAPGRIEQAAAEKIQGKVKVNGLSIGWFAPTIVGPVEIIDPDGKTVARVNIKTPTTLMKIVQERWWSMTRLDVGEVEVAGMLDLIRDSKTGKTNLERALEPRQVASAPKSDDRAGGSGGAGKSTLEIVRAVLKVNAIDATVRERDAAGQLSPELGVKGLAGNVKVEYQAQPMTLVSVADLSGTPVGGGSSEPVKLALDANIRPKAGGSGLGALDTAKVKLNVTNAPVGLVDALAAQGGALVKGVGPRADVALNASGTPKDAEIRLDLASQGAQADLNLSVKDGVVTAMPPSGSGNPNGASTITLQSTEFLASMPALREALQKAGQQVQVSKAPGVSITIDKLRWPLPPGAMGDANAAPMANQDYRNAGLNATIRVTEMQGKVALDAPAPGVPGGPAAAPTQWRSFAVEPTVIEIRATDLSQPVEITGGTRATIDGSPAGDVSLRATAAGLLDAQGRLRVLANAGLADTVDAQLSVQGMSTALVQPVLAGANLPIDLKTDVGPTLDVALNARADVKQLDPAAAGKDALPPIDATMNVTSSNVRVTGAGRYAGGVVSTTGEGLSVVVNSAAPMASRILTAPGQPSTLALSGLGGVNITVRNFSAPKDKLTGADALAAVRGLVRVEVTDLGVLPLTATPEANAPAQQPVKIGRLTTNITIDGANPPQVDLASNLSHENQPFDLKGQIRLDGIVGGKLPSAAAGAARIIAFKPTGRIDLTNLPRSVLNVLPATQAYGTTAIVGTDMPSQINRAIRESIGAGATVSITLQPQGETLAMTSTLGTAAGGVSATTSALLGASSVRVDALQMAMAMDPRTVNPVLASANTPEPGAPAAAPIQLGQPFKLTIASSEPINMPLKAGTFSPDFAQSSDAVIKLSTDNDIAIDNVPTGADPNGQPRTVGVRVRGLKADVRAPLSGLDPALKASKRMNVAFGLNAVRSQDNATIADVTGTINAGMDGSNPDANVKVASIDTAVADGLIGKPGLLAGALGDKADANLKMQPSGGVTNISAEIVAPRLTDAKLDLVQDKDKIALTKPTTIAWRPEASFLNSMLGVDTVAAAEPAPQQPRRRRQNQQPAPAGSTQLAVAQIAPVTINLSKLVLASSKTENGQQTAGPLKPGVFDLDASLTAPSVAMSITGRGQQPSTLGMEGIQATVKQAAGTQGAGELVANLNIAKVVGGGATAPKPSTANIRVTNYADARGVPTPNAAIVNLESDLVSFPTPIIDQLAHQGGILAELLGPTVDVRAIGKNVSAGGGNVQNAAGTVEFKATSPRAGAEIKGEIRNGMFVQTGPLNFQIMEIRPELIRMLQGSVPVVESLSKTTQDPPAQAATETVSIPIDGDLSKLNGVMRIDPGVARFTTNNVFGEILQLVGGNATGEIGRKIDPFVVRAVNGVLTYDQFKLPLGSFDLQTKGTVDLVRRQVDVVTYAPLFALTDRAAGSLNTGIAGRLGVLDRNTLVPITTKGPMGNTKTELDIGLFIKERGDAFLKQPEKIIDNVIGDLLKPKDKPKK